MEEKIEERSQRSRNRVDHLANERTFLAWIRTSLGIMAFGFVVVKFSLFTKQIALFLGRESSTRPAYSPHWVSIFGIALIGVGILLSLFSLVNYKQVGKEIEGDFFHPSSKLPLAVTLAVLLVGTFLLIYLIID